MTQLTSLAWKEWRESRWALIVGLGTFLVLPIIGALEDKASFGRFELEIMPAVLLLGGVLAVFTAVGATCRDLRPKLEDFWRSRPVGSMPWLLAKYFVGLGMVLFACGVPLLVDIALNPPNRDHATTANVLKWFPFVWTALYSLAFLAGCTVRRMAHATMLSLAAMLLVYFIPILLPTLKWLSVNWLLQSEYERPRNLPLLPFAAGMLSISAAALVASLVIVGRGLKVESGQKIVFGAVGASLVLLVGSAAYPIANNLPLVGTATLPSNEIARQIYSDGQRGIILASQRNDALISGVYPLKSSSTQLELGPKINLPKAAPARVFEWSFGWVPDHPQYAFLAYLTPTESGLYACMLQPINSDSPNSLSPALRVWEGKGDEKSYGTVFFALHNRLYIRGKEGGEIVVVDVSVPDQLRIESTDHWEHYISTRRSGEPRNTDIVTLEFNGPAGFTNEDVLAYFSSKQLNIDGNVLCRTDDGRLNTYRLTDYTRHIAHFKRVGTYEPAPLDGLYGEFSGYPGMYTRNGLVYVARRGGEDLVQRQFRMTVFDIRDPVRPHPIGHFGLPTYPRGEDISVQPLPDGRAIIGRTKLYLVGKPSIRQ